MADVGTPLYYFVLAYDHGDAERNALQRTVWSGTPWMVDAYTGGNGDDRDRAIYRWCAEHFGPEAWPIHGKPGAWHRGGATINGWTWMGFATEAMLREFEAAWPPPDGAALPPDPPPT